MDSDDEDSFPPKRSPLAGFVNNPQLRKLCSPGFGQIYWIQPLVSKSNGYIGQNTTSLFKRLQCHVAPSNRCIKLQRAFKTHGLDNFTVCLLEEDVPIDKLNDAEMRWIAKLDTWKNGYNCVPGGSPANVYKDPEVYARHIASHNTIDYRTKASKRSKDQHARPGERERKIARVKAQHQDPIKKKHHIDGIKKGWVKRKANGNTLSISVSGKAVWANPEYHQRRCKALKERTEEQIDAFKAACSRGQSNVSTEVGSDRVRRGWQNISPEDRAARVRKGWATRRAKQGLA